MQAFLKIKQLMPYCLQRTEFAALITIEDHQAGQIALKDLRSTFFKNTFTRQMLYLHRSKDLGMAPTITPEDTLVIRRFPALNSRFHLAFKKHLPKINLGDVVVLQDPSDSENYIIRRLAAVEGYEMVSTNEDDEPFVLEQGQGWVLADKRSLSPKESKDSRTYGPISMSDIVGRVVYRFRTVDDQGFMVNNKLSMTYDMPIFNWELDSGKMHRFADEGKQTKSSKDDN